MADPTFTECGTQLASDCALLEKDRLALVTQTNNYAGLVDISQQNAEGDYVGDRQAAIDAHRALNAATISDNAARNLLGPAIRNFSKLINSGGRDAAAVLRDLYDYMQAVAVAAQATLTMDTNPTDGDTITIGAVTYTFKTSLSSTNHVKIGAAVADTQASLVAVIMGTGAPGTDYYIGSTSPHPTVKCASAFDGSDQLVLTARTKGTAGNSLASTETFTAGTNVFDDTTFGTTTAGVNAYTVLSRAITRGSVSATSTNVGNVTIKRWTTNPDGYAIENGFADYVTAECVRAGFGKGGPQLAQFKLFGRDPGRDRIVERGAAPFGAQTRLAKTISELTGKTSDSYGVANGTFAPPGAASAADASALTGAPSGWTVVTGTATNWKVSKGTAGTHYYRDVFGVSVGAGIDFYESFKIWQRIDADLDYSRPYCRMLVFKTEDSAAGELRLRVGSTIKIVDVSTVTGFGILDLGDGADSWAQNFNEYNTTLKGLELSIEWTRTAGNLILCEVIFAPVDLYDGVGYAATPNATGTTAHTYPQAGGLNSPPDSYIFDDTTETGAILSRWLARGYRFQLPTIASTPTISEPTVT